MNYKAEIRRLNDLIATASATIATERKGVATILAACEVEGADPREPTAEESQQLETATAVIKTKEAAVENWQAQRDNLAAALAADEHAQVIRTSGDSHGVEVDASLRGTGTVAEDRPDAGFDNLGQFATLAAQASTPSTGMRDQRLAPLAAVTGMGTVVGSEGGFLIPPAFSTAIWDRMQQNESNLLPFCDSHPVAGKSLTLNANAETSRATGSRMGGIRGYWRAEGAQLTASFPKFRQIELKPNELTVLVYATNELLGDVAALESYLTQGASDEIAFMASDAIVNGTGAGQPRGLITGATDKPRVRVNKETGQAAATIVAENIMNMYARLVPSAVSGARWLINQGTLPQLLKMHVAVGTGGVPVYLPQNQLVSSPYGTLMGLPVQPVEFCQALGTEGDIILTNLGFYCLGVKGGVQSAMSMHLRFDYNESVFRFIFHVDGEPWLNSSLTPYKGSDTVGPTITLQTRS